MMKSKWIFTGLLILPLLFILFHFCKGEMGSLSSRQPELQTFQLGNGWGYKIVLNKKTLIYQPTIPAIDSVQSFPTETSARKTGLLVLERLNQNKDFSITTDDLKDSLSD